MSSPDPRPDSEPTPEQPLRSDDVDPSHDDVTVRTPDTEEERLGEAGHAYVGREASRDTKTNPRVLDADRALDAEERDAEDDAGDAATGDAGASESTGR